MKTVKKGSEFEKEVEKLLQLKGYVVTRNNLINGTQIDLHATKNDPLEKICFVVECADRANPIGVDLVKEKSSILLTLKNEPSIYRLLFVSRNGFTAEAKTFANFQSNIILYTLTELEKILVDLSPYANSYVYNYEKSLGVFKDANLMKTYVPLSARDTNDKLILSVDAFIKDWINKDDNNLIFLLGEYGSGKSSFCRHFTYKLLKEKYIENSDLKHTPILINLKEFRGKLDLKRVVIDTLVNVYGVSISSYSTFERICATGSIILILDGYDEMSDRSDQQTLVDSFNQIYLMAALQTKIILTCRSNFFRSTEEIINLLKRFSISLPDEENNQILEFSLNEQGLILYLEKLNDKQITEFVKKRFGANSTEIINTINKIHDLSDLSTRPVLLDMILSTLPELKKSKRRINSAALYKYYTNRWTNRDQWRVSIPLKIRQTFCETLSWVMNCSDITEISYNTLDKILTNSLSKLSTNKEQFEKYKNDIQTCSFLVRSGTNNDFRFAHKSFVEYFFAQKLINDLTAGVPIEKANMDEWFPESQKINYKIDEHFFINHGVSNRKAFMVDYIRDLMNVRLRSHPSFNALVDAEFSTYWSSSKSINIYFETEIQSVFKNKLLTSFSQEILITEEIATFAIEIIYNLSISFKTIIDKLLDSNSIDIFSDILRFAQSFDWVIDNVKEIKKYIEKGNNENLKIACITTLIKQKSYVDLSFIRSVRGNISERGWSYTLFELSNKADQYEKLIATIIQNDKLKPLDQAICLFGLSGKFPGDEKSEKLSLLVTELLKSDENFERDLAIKVCYTLNEKERTGIIVNAFQTVDSTALKNAMIKVLEETTDQDSWKLFRMLAIKESDPKIKKTLQKTEQLLRDISSRQKSRTGWNRVDGYKTLRDTIWKWK